MTDTDALASDAGVPDFRRMPVPQAIAWLAEHGEPADPRPDIDTASLKRRFPRLAGVLTEDRAVEGPHGAVPVRSYVDPGAPRSVAALVWVHGGAFIGGHLDMPESNWVAHELAARGIPVIAVDYTKCLGDVHFPVPSDDVLAAWRYARDVAANWIGVDAENLALGGGSAGGNLTAGVAGRLRDAGEAPPAGLVLVYPVLHPNGPAASVELDPDSPMSDLTRNFAGSDAALTDPHAFAGTGEAAGFPPTLVVVCEHDPLRTSGEVFAAALADGGVPVDLRVEADADHGHIDHPGDEGALRTLDAMTAWLTR